MKYESLILLIGSIPMLLSAAANNGPAWKRSAENGYGPVTVDCPSAERPSVRDSRSLSSHERSWLEQRRNKTVPAMRELLRRLNITGFDSDSYFDNANNSSDLPNIGIAVSGGGYRALMNGAGAVAAFDSRTPGSTGAGQLGGLLQSATYFAGLSGGGWLVSSLYANDFPTVQDILYSNDDDPLWQFQSPIWEGPDMGSTGGSSSAGEYFEALAEQVGAKMDAGFDVSITDFWGRALSYQLLTRSDVNSSFVFSSIQQNAKFKSGDLPMPILVADGRSEGQVMLLSTNTTNYEFTPWELGSFDSIGFAPLQYAGSNFSAGKIPVGEECVTGLDQVSYVFGTSSTLFNQFILQINQTDMVPDILKTLITGVLDNLGDNRQDVADWSPNPFYHWANSTNPTAQSKALTLVDGGEDLQNIPFTPLIQPLRNVDVIFAVDSSADTLSPRGLNWPNGTAMVATYERSQAQDAGKTFPAVPDVNTFINLGLNARPTLFGCDAGNLTADSTAPLVVYLPNSPYVYNSNVSTFTMTYEVDVRDAVVLNGYSVATRGNGTLDARWPACVGCAIMARSWHRANATVPEFCERCFEEYCWDGTVNSSTPAPVYEPKMALQALDVKSGAAMVRAGGAMAALFSAGVMVAMAFVM